MLEDGVSLQGWPGGERPTSGGLLWEGIRTEDQTSPACTTLSFCPRPASSESCLGYDSSGSQVCPSRSEPPGVGPGPCISQVSPCMGGMLLVPAQLHKPSSLEQAHCFSHFSGEDTASPRTEVIDPEATMGKTQPGCHQVCSKLSVGAGPSQVAPG